MPYVVQPSLLPQLCPRFDCEPSNPRADYLRPDGAMLDPGALPARAVQVSPHKRLPDFINLFGTWCVSEPFRRMVEEREPGVHAFYPLPLFHRDGSAVETPYHLFDVRQQVDAVVPELSAITWNTQAVRPLMMIGDYTKLTLDMGLLERRHVWRGKTQFFSRFFFSDELAQAVEKAKMKKLSMWKTQSTN